MCGIELYWSFVPLRFEVSWTFIFIFVVLDGWREYTRTVIGSTSGSRQVLFDVFALVSPQFPSNLVLNFGDDLCLSLSREPGYIWLFTCQSSLVTIVFPLNFCVYPVLFGGTFPQWNLSFLSILLSSPKKPLICNLSLFPLL